MQSFRHDGARGDDQFHAWLKQWSKRSDQIAARLEMIDMQLDSMFQSAPSAPFLRIIDSAEQ